MLDEIKAGIPSHVTRRPHRAAAADGRRAARAHERQHLPLRRLLQHRRSDRRSRRERAHEALHLRARAARRPRPPRPPRARPGAKFIAGGTNLLDLMKLRDRDADAPDRRQRPGARQDRGDAGRRPAHRRAGAQHRPRRRRARAARLRRAVARAARRRLGPAAQQGDHRRQPAAAHALPVLLRHQPAVQQARSPAAAARAIGGFSRQHAVVGVERRLHRHASERHGGRDARARRDGRDGAARRRARARSRSPTSTACPATRRTSRPRSSRAS